MPILLMFYRRHLPHWQKADKALFLTWRLDGSLPLQILLASRKEENPGKRFLLLDGELDQARYGPTWLKDIRVAKTVVNSLSHGEDHLELYGLSAYVVMSNHVHVLLWAWRYYPELPNLSKALLPEKPIAFWIALEKSSGKMNPSII